MSKWIMLLLSIGIGGFYSYKMFLNIEYVSTENAFVVGENSEILSPVDGNIKYVHVLRGMTVKKGQILFELDDTPIRNNISLLQNELLALQDVISERCYEEKGHRLNVKKSTLDVAIVNRDYQRAKTLFDKKSISEHELIEIHSLLETAKKNLEISEAKLTHIESMNLAYFKRQPQAQRILLDLKRAFYDLSHYTIRAPIDGIVHDLTTLEGNYVTEGTQLGRLLSLDNRKVIANVLEYKMDQVKIGQRVEVAFSANQSLALEGKVTGITPGVTGLFTNIPIYNTDSNWIKVSQRVPVHIELSAKSIPFLPVGSSAKIKINIKEDNLTRDNINSIANHNVSNKADNKWESAYTQFLDEEITPILSEFRNIDKANCITKSNIASTHH